GGARRDEPVRGGRHDDRLGRGRADPVGAEQRVRDPRRPAVLAAGGDRRRADRRRLRRPAQEAVAATQVVRWGKNQRRSKVRRKALAIGLAALLVLAAGCSKKSPSSGGGKKAYKLRLVQGVAGEQFYISMQCGATD